MNKFIISFVGIYQKFFSPDTGIFGRKRVCAFYPTCSEYARLCFQKYSFFRAFYKACARILCCHPWQKNHIDVP